MSTNQETSIFLQQLNISNFKGIVEKKITFFQKTDISGKNGSSKSTIYTAFNWLLTGKDEFDRSDYELKNTVRKDLNNQAHEVEGIFIVNGKQEHKFKRVYLEKWRRPQGQTQKVFDGHTTEYYYNDVKYNEKDYLSYVDKLINSKIVKLITNPYYFNTLNWQDQRRGLLAIGGEITTESILAKIATPQNDYMTLILVLNSGKTLKQYKDELNQKKLKLKKLGEQFEPRIDEVRKNIPKVDDWAAIEAELGIEESKMLECDARINDVVGTNKKLQEKITELNKKKFERESALNNRKNELRTGFIAKQGNSSSEISLLKNGITMHTTAIDNLNRSKQSNATNRTSYQDKLKKNNEQIAVHRTNWDKINGEQFKFDVDTCTCPTCKQLLPATDIEEQRITLQNNFNTDVLARKTAEVNASNKLKNENATLEKQLLQLDTSDADIDKMLLEETNGKETKEQQLNILQEAEQNKTKIDIDAEVLKLVMADETAQNIGFEIAGFISQIQSEEFLLSQETNNDADVKLKGELQTKINSLNVRLGVKTTITNMEERLEQLLNEEAANAQEISTIEQQEADIMAYTRAEMDILQDRVNTKFKYVQFRLFKELVNGTIDEDCVCMYQGVPYPSLNTAAKLLAGIDVLNTLSEYYKTYAPVFCDNRESAFFIPDSKSQIVSLYHNPLDETIIVKEGK